MKAIQVQHDLTVRISEIDNLRPGPGEALVRVHAAGVCGTDLHIVDGMIKPDAYPMTLGHEAAGVVEQAGPGVSITPGTRVAVFNKLFCGACEQCLLGRQNLCLVEPGQLGFNRDGGDADYDALVAETTGLLDRLADPADSRQWPRLSEVFAISIRYEGEFWDMALAAA